MGSVETIMYAVVRRRTAAAADRRAGDYIKEAPTATLYVETQKSLQLFCQKSVAVRRSVADFLSAEGHCIRLE